VWKKVFVMMIIAVALIVTVVYSKNCNLVFSELNLKNTSHKVEAFLDLHNSKNGIYMQQDGTGEAYLFLNGYNVVQGEMASYFTDIKAEVKEGTLIINFNEKYTDAYKNKEINNRVLYKIKQLKTFHTIRIYKNGEETHFDSIDVR
jgi:hypothetical protein